MAVAYLALGVTTALRQPIAFLAVLIAAKALEISTGRNELVHSRLNGGDFGPAARAVVCEMATVALVLGSGWETRGPRTAAALCVLGVSALRLSYQAGLTQGRARYSLPVETRNIDLPLLRMPPVPHPLLVTETAERSRILAALGLVGASLGVITGSPSLLFATVAVVLAIELVWLGLLGRWLLAGRKASTPEEVTAAVRDRVIALRPQVMLYHSGAPTASYQVNMWLSTLEALPRSTIVVLRERSILRHLEATSLPVMCIPGPVDLDRLGLGSVRVALYVNNAGKNVPLVRESGIEHVFIGHGDSDKDASSNPFSKIYNQIWVAGPAGRERYIRSRAGFRVDDIVDVGRPQISGVDTYAGPIGAAKMTVLYAPTWEGFDGEAARTSSVRTGPTLVTRLLSRPDVRLLYKPHPHIGKESAAAAAADKQIRSAIRRARGRHRVIVGSTPTLYDCFNKADLLIADVSAVLSEFIATGKPYAVVNLTSMDDEAFRAAFPATSAAYLLDQDGEPLDETLQHVRVGDPLAPRRRELRDYLLGADEPGTRSRFLAAVDAAYQRAVQRSTSA